MLLAFCVGVGVPIKFDGASKFRLGVMGVGIVKNTLHVGIAHSGLNLVIA